MENSEERRISEYDFVVRAIKKLRKHPYKGIHVVYSGFNRAFREYFGKDPIEATTGLAEEGKIIIRPVKHGVMLYLPDEAPEPWGSKGALKKILEENNSEDELEILGPDNKE